MRGRILVVGLVVVLALSLALAGCGEKAADSGTGTSTTPSAPAVKTVEAGKLLAGSDTSFPPFESMNGSTAEGFDVDLVAAIAKELGLESKFMTEGFDTLIPTLKAGGKFDIIASGMTITDERKQEIDFSDPYIDSNQSIAMKAGSTYTDPASLKGKKVGCQAGTTGLDWANENLKPAGASIVEFKTATDALNALQAGNVAAVVNDLPVSASLIKNDPSKGLAIVKEIPTGEQYGFGVSKDNPELLKAINDALKTLKDNGEYQKIYDTWFATQ
jgi:polar amino acid transport system substrate-binding protein